MVNEEVTVVTRTSNISGKRSRVMLEVKQSAETSNGQKLDRKADEATVTDLRTKAFQFSDENNH